MFIILELGNILLGRILYFYENRVNLSYIHLLLCPFPKNKENSCMYTSVFFTNENLFLFFGSIFITQCKRILSTRWLLKTFQLTEQFMNDTKSKALTGLTMTKCRGLRQAKTMNFKICHKIGLVSLIITVLHELGKEAPPSKATSSSLLPHCYAGLH